MPSVVDDERLVGWNTTGNPVNDERLVC